MLDARYLLFILLLVTLFGVRAQQSGPVINELPPGVTQCGNSQISWLGGVPPYILSIVDPSSGNVLVSLEQTVSQSSFGKINIPAGTTIIFKVTDSTGAASFSESVVVQNGEDDSCYGQPEEGTPVVGNTSQPPPQATTFQTPLSSSSSLSPAPPSLDPAASSFSFPPPQSAPPFSQSTFPPSQSTPLPPSLSSPPLSQPSSSSFISQSTTVQGQNSSPLSSSASLLSSSGSLAASSSSLTISQPTNVPAGIPPATTTISTSSPSLTPSELSTFQGPNLSLSTSIFPSASRASTSSPPSISTSGSDNSSATSSGNRNATIARVIAGVLAAVVLITVAAYLLWRRRARRFRDEVHTMESQDGPRLLQRVQQAVRDSQARPTVLSFPLPPGTLPTHGRDNSWQTFSGEAGDGLGTNGESAALKSPLGPSILMVRPDKLRLSDP